MTGTFSSETCDVACVEEERLSIDITNTMLTYIFGNQSVYVRVSVCSAMHPDHSDLQTAD